jgi:tRNA nucleotidyltransferase (CCA-adding enzyme)
MELITTHVAADFDALASMVAASKLYPQAKLVFPGSAERNVRELLNSPAYSYLQFERLKSLDLKKVERLILVDTKLAHRIGPLAELLQKSHLSVHIYDHHPTHPKDINGEVEVLGETGATTTILLETLREKKIPLTPSEATLLLLGIYEDTGFLTYSSTTPRDLGAASYLLSLGADLTAVSDNIHREMSADQVALLYELMNAAERYFINGVELVIATATVERYVGDLAVLTQRLRDIENINVLFVLVRMDNRIHAVGRSRSEAVDVADVLGEIGGGGHPTAASATIKDLTVIQAKEKLIKILKTKIHVVKTAKDVMTAPVKAVAAEFTIDGAHELMNRFSINVLPVVYNGELVGMISRETVDKAVYHGLSESLVKEFMSVDLMAVSPEEPLQRVQALMAEHNLSLLPVVEERRLKGVVSRADVLHFLYEEGQKAQTALGAKERGGYYYRRNLASIMKIRLPSFLGELLKKIGEVADQESCSAYAVGGFVRDLLLRVENYDIDIVIEGDGIAFAERLAERMGGRFKSHKKFGTAVVTLPDEFKIDVATARTEYYQYPAALPTVEMSSIKQDLYRRDFTINTLAIHLNRDKYGQLIDFFGGQRDLVDKVIRVLHNLSFIEDPTRALRAVRFEKRFDFKIAKHAEQLIKNSVKMEVFEKLSPTRLLGELILILKEGKSFEILKRLEDLGVLRSVHPKFKMTKEATRLFDRVDQVLAWYSLQYPEQALNTWRLHFLCLVDTFTLQEFLGVLKRLQMSPRRFLEIKEDFLFVKRILAELQKEVPYKPSQIYFLLKEASLEALLFIMAKSTKEAIKRHIWEFITQYSKITIALRGKDLQTLGFKPGPIYQDILRGVLAAKLDGEIKTPPEEREWVKSKYLSLIAS